jgi:hypothetical protein
MKVAECSPTDKYLRIQINETIDFRFYYCFFHSFFSLVLFASGGVCFYLKTTDFARLCLPMTTDMFRFATTKHMNLDGEVSKMYSFLVFFVSCPFCSLPVACVFT